MHLTMNIANVKSITSFELKIPLEQGLYAITGENGCGKSTILSCLATSFYNPLMYSYFGAPRTGAKIEFDFCGKVRKILSSNGQWFDAKGSIGITGFYEGSLIFGNRFKDVDFRQLKKVAAVKKEELIIASEFVRENLGSILHDDASYYKNLYILNDSASKKYNFLKQPYYYETNSSLVNQLNMSTGENLLISILHSLDIRLAKETWGNAPSLILLDEIELALHSSALRRLMFFLEGLSSKHNFCVYFSTHSIELIRSIQASKIYYIQKHVDNTIEIINPCYPVYATRNLESSNYGHDYIIMVEDTLAKSIVDKILREKRLLGNKRVLVLPVGGWCEVIRFAYDTIRSNLALSTTKILIILDRDIQNSVNAFMKKEKIGFANPPEFLPIKSLEKYLLENLVSKVDHKLFRQLNDYVFQGNSLSDIVQKYQSDITNGIIKDIERIKNGKVLFDVLEHELHQIRKSSDVLTDEVVKYLFEEKNAQIEELTSFLVTMFS